METNSIEIIVYGTVWCGDTRRARAYLDQNKISYRWIDIDLDKEARKYVESVNRGYRSVPTIIFPDGSMLVEPSVSQLAAKLGIPQT
jgi:glutaredoxin-like protein